MSDSWSAFWERLLVGVVAVLVVSFVVQGLWFFLTDLAARLNPTIEPSLVRASARLGVPWILATAAGVGWVAWRSWGEMEREPIRR